MIEKVDEGGTFSQTPKMKIYENAKEALSNGRAKTNQKTRNEDGSSVQD